MYKKMATQAQLAKCNPSQEPHQTKPVSGNAEPGRMGPGSLKNGTDMDQDDNSEDVPEKRPTTKRKSKHQGRGGSGAGGGGNSGGGAGVTMENFQDGGENQTTTTNVETNNSSRTHYHPHQPSPSNMQDNNSSIGGDGSRLMNNYAQHPARGGGDEYGTKMNDVYGGGRLPPPPHSPSSYNMGEHQHGGPLSSANMDLGPNVGVPVMYDQYGGGNLRPNYSPNAKQPMTSMSHLNRPGPGGGPMMVPGVPYNAAQRSWSGGLPSLNQHVGPTPTLNQLLQSPNPVQRYQSNSYGEYHMGGNSGAVSSVGGNGSNGATAAGSGGNSAPQPKGPSPSSGANSGGNSGDSQQVPYPAMQNWPGGVSGRGHLNMYQPPMGNNGGYRNQGGPMHDMGSQSSGKRPVQPQPTYMGPGPGGNSPYPSGGNGGAGNGNNSGSGLPPSPQQSSSQQQQSPQAPPGLQPPPSPHSQYNTQYPSHRYSSPSPQGRSNLPISMANQPYSPQMTHQYPPQQGPPPSPMTGYDQRYIPISPQQQQHCPQNYPMNRGPNQQQQGLPSQPPSTQQLQTSSPSSSSTSARNQSSSPHGPLPSQLPCSSAGQSSTPQPTFSTSTITSSSSLLSSSSHIPTSTQNKDGCEQVLASSNNVETTGSVDDALSDSSNQSLSSNQGSQGLQGGGGGGNSGGIPPAGVSPLRPTPSPSGSSGSRSMSPAVGPQQQQQTPLPSQQQQNIPMPPRPSSGQSEGGQQRLSQSPMAATQGYNQPIPPSHMGPPMYGGKMHSNMMAPYSPQSQPYPSGGTGGRNPNGGGSGGMGMQGYNNYHGGHPNNMSHPFANRVPPQGYPNQYLGSQYGGQNYPLMNANQSPQQQPPPLPHSTGVSGGKGGSGIPSGAQVAAQAAVMAAAAVNSTPGGPAQRHSSPYMKPHMQQRGGYSQGPIPSMNYNSGSPGGGPPQGMLGMLGPPGSGGGNRDSPVMQMPPPAPPSSTTPTPSSASMMLGGPPGHPTGGPTANSTPPHLASTAVGNLSENSCDNSNESNVPSMGSGQGELRGMPLSLGMPMGSNDGGGNIHDEASQHSTASNASTADERAETPRPKKDIPMSHPPTPASALPSPGAASISSYHDDFESVSSPSWPRTPASPVVNSQHHEYHPKRPDGLHKLYDISDDPDRRHFLDRLIQFNEERGSTITQCPTISKHPLDLYRLYLAAKERGGFLEVTKGKLWKEVAGIVGVGASSSGAYTLRKQYIKHLLPFECKFDQGGIDPRPIISQLESSTRKKNSKTVAAPSPGSSNSQDSIHQNNNQSLDSFPSQSSSYTGNQYPQGHSGPPSGDYIGMDSHHSSPMMPNHTGHPPGNGNGTNSTPMMVGATNPADSINVQNPFADDIPHCYPRNGIAGANSGTMQGGMVGSQLNYSYGGHHRPQALPSNYPNSNQSGTGSPYPQYPDSMPRAGGPPQRPPMQPAPHDQFAGDGYRRSQVTNHEGYPNRPIPDQYVAGTGSGSTSYPPVPPQGRPAMQANASGHYAYGPQYDRERYEQSQNVAVSANPPNVLPPHGQPSDPNMYPPQHRYPNQQIMPRSYVGTAPIPGPGSNAAAPNAPNPVPVPPNQPNPPTSTPYQTPPSPQDPNFQQNYTPGQSTMYTAPNKMIAPYGHQGPKRHPDFLKLPDNQYPPFSSASPGSQPPPAANTTVATSVASSAQIQTPPTQQSPPQTQQPPPGSMYQAWRSDGQYSQYPNQGPTTQPPSQLPPPTGAREDWDPRRPPADPSAVNSQWPGMHSRYPSPSQSGPPSNNQGPTVPQQPPSSHSSGGYYYQQNNVVPPSNQMLVPPVPSPPSTNARIRIAVPRDKQQPPLQPPFSAIGPSKIAPPQMITNAQYTPRKEIVFPDNSVEAVTPLLVKRRRLAARDIIPVDPWRLMMALKSGLLCESTWALDVLSVLLYDEGAVLYFNLQHLPGLLDVLLEHYRKCLAQMFVSEDDSVSRQPSLDNPEKWYEFGKEVEDSNENDEDDMKCSERLQDLGVVNHVDCNDKVVLLDSENYTYYTSRGKTVKVVSNTDLFVSDDKRPWDEFNSFEQQPSKSSFLQFGPSSDLASHVQTHFEMERRRVSFVRLMKDVVKSETENCIKVEIDSYSPKCRKESTTSNAISESLCSSAILIKQEPVEDDNKCDNYLSSLEVDNENDEKLKRSHKRRRVEDYEDEAYNRDEASLYLVNDAQDSLARRALCLSNILRSLSFVPGNDTELSKSQSFLSVMGKLLLIHHEHALRKVSPRNYDKDDEPDINGSCSSLYGEKEWWWDALHILRENTLVTLANISGRLDLSIFPEEVGLPILDGLLHWAVCPSAYAMDPLPSLPPQSILSPQRLSLEALCKLSVQECNVDLVLATPPFSRIERLFGFLSRSLGRYEDQVVREFAVVLLHYFAQADSGVARNIALQSQCISLLIAFVEQAEQNAVQVVNTHGLNMLRENSEMMGTSLDMLRRAAHTLFCLSQVPDNRSLFVQHQHRLLQLVTSQILDQHVASIVADVLFECSTDDLDPS